MTAARDRISLAYTAAKSVSPHVDSDLYGEAILAALSCPRQETGIIWLAARYAVIDYLRRELGDRRSPAWREKRVVSLDGLMARWRQQVGANLEGGGEYLDTPLEPQCDPWPEMQARLEAREIWAWLLPRLTAREREVLTAWIWHGESQRHIADRLGLHLNRVYQLAKSGLDRYRRHAGWSGKRKTGRIG